jgi:hypothetical protein
LGKVSAFQHSVYRSLFTGNPLFRNGRGGKKGNLIESNLSIGQGERADLDVRIVDIFDEKCRLPLFVSAVTVQTSMTHDEFGVLRCRRVERPCLIIADVVDISLPCEVI